METKTSRTMEDTKRFKMRKLRMERRVEETKTSTVTKPFVVTVDGELDKEYPKFKLAMKRADKLFTDGIGKEILVTDTRSGVEKYRHDTREARNGRMENG
jgi:electron transfer flavoprotein alpha/beta subunit